MTPTRYALDLDVARRAVESFDPSGVESYAEAREAILTLLARTSAPASRDQFDPGHLTASAIVLSATRDSVLLVHHKRLGRWLQPGGHIEHGDLDLLQAARRECLEETGAELDTGVAPLLVGMDVHEIPAARGEPAHLHHDVLYAFVAGGTAIEHSDESNSVTWAPIDDFARFEPDPPLARTVARTVEILGGP